MKNILLIGILAASLPLSVACNSFSLSETGPDSLSASVIENIDNSNVSVSKFNLVASTLNDQEITDLTFMREEEKLAHDVYIFLYKRYGLSIFNNIAGSEQMHTDSVKLLLDFYGINDPVASMELGKFDNTDLQTLYDQLIEQGSLSLSEALKVGTAIEEIDILDLQEAIENTTQVNILRVYNNLLQGSYNHLRAFTSTLGMQSGTNPTNRSISHPKHIKLLLKVAWQMV